jgi:hypothetical protein
VCDDEHFARCEIVARGEQRGKIVAGLDLR